MVDTPSLTSLMRSAAMLQRNQKYPVDRDDLIDLCQELLSCRQLLQRLGTDLRTVAAHGTRPAEARTTQSIRPAG